MTFGYITFLQYDVSLSLLYIFCMYNVCRIFFSDWQNAFTCCFLVFFKNMFNIYIHVLILKEKVQSYSHIYFLLDWRVIFWLFEILVYWCSCMLGPCENFCPPTRHSFDSFFFVDAQHISKTILKRLTCHSV